MYRSFISHSGCTTKVIYGSIMALWCYVEGRRLLRYFDASKLRCYFDEKKDKQKRDTQKRDTQKRDKQKETNRRETNGRFLLAAFLIDNRPLHHRHHRQ